jgi:hypothetical protein
MRAPPALSPRFHGPPGLKQTLRPSPQGVARLVASRALIMGKGPPWAMLFSPFLFGRPGTDPLPLLPPAPHPSFAPPLPTTRLLTRKPFTNGWLPQPGPSPLTLPLSHHPYHASPAPQRVSSDPALRKPLHLRQGLSQACQAHIPTHPQPAARRPLVAAAAPLSTSVRAKPPAPQLATPGPLRPDPRRPALARAAIATAGWRHRRLATGPNTSVCHSVRPVPIKRLGRGRPKSAAPGACPCVAAAPAPPAGRDAPPVARPPLAPSSRTALLAHLHP